jgi:ubiquinone/menaquinone biosynthesis C-methylase UbiE
MTSARRRVSELQHPDARSFELVADLYERARPGYPQEAIDWVIGKLGIASTSTVLDLGAGTGKLTRALVETDARVIAVEPGDAMRAELERALPDVETLRGAAEAIPLPDRSVDCVAIGQAFHWFRHEEAMPELHRVLRPGGGLALLWNSRDPEAPVHQEISTLVSPFVPPDRSGHDTWPKPLEQSRLFTQIEEAHFKFVQELDADALSARISSTSFVAAAPVEARRDLDLRLREVAERLGGVVAFPYVTNVYVSFAV